MANTNKVLKTRIVQKFDTAANWEQSTLVLLKGELALDELNRIKIGNGTSKWSELPFAVDGKATAISFPTELPAVDSTDCKAGELVLTPDGKLWCLTGSDETPAERAWVDLTNKAEIEGLQEALQSAVVALRTEMAQKDEAHDAALVALQATVGSGASDLEALASQLNDRIDAVEADVTTNAENIGANRADLDEVTAEVEALDTAFDTVTGDNDEVPVIKRRLKATAMPAEVYDHEAGKINASVLPSFVDDVVEGLVCIGSDATEQTYSLTHNGDSVVGFFAVLGADVEGSERNLKFVTAADPESIKDVDLGSLPHEENGITYKFPQKPAEAIIAPSSSMIYVDVKTNMTYRWSGSQFVVVASDLALGETASTAYAGDKGAEVYAEVFTNETGLKARATALEGEVADLKEVDAAHDAAIVALNGSIEGLRQDAEAKHQELEDEIASSVVALKTESEKADAAHDAAIVSLQSQINSMGANVQAMDLDTVLDNSGDTLNTNYIVLDCGDAEVVNP